MFSFRPRNTDGRILEGDTPYGRFRVEWDAHGNLLHHEIEIREPPKLIGDRIESLTKKLGIPTCGGCRKRKKQANEVHAAWNRVVGNTLTILHLRGERDGDSPTPVRPQEGVL